MTLDDLKKLATGSLLFSLDRILGPRLVNILYLLGLAAIAMWAISHFFTTFSFSFGAGLWGLVEIVVFGLLGFIILRIVCEAVIVFFKANEGAADAATASKTPASLIEEVRDAIEELADDEPLSEEEIYLPPVSEQKPKPTPRRRTAKRSAKPKT